MATRNLPRKTLLRIKLETDLVEAIRTMGLENPTGPRDLYNMIDCALRFAVREHRKGRDLDSRKGVFDWRNKAEREIEELRGMLEMEDRYIKAEGRG